MQFTQSFKVRGFNPETGYPIEEERIVDVISDSERLVVVLGCPGVEDVDRPDLCIEWQPGKGWCIYAHGHGSDEVQAKLVMNPDSVLLEAV